MTSAANVVAANPVLAARRKFLRAFPKGFYAPTYLAWERGYKWQAHKEWERVLSRSEFRSMLKSEAYGQIATHALQIEGRTNLLFSFEKMALRDAVRSPSGARAFAVGLYDFLHGPGQMKSKFERWCGVVESLPRKRSRVLTWPVVTIFGFIALPGEHIYLKPKVTRVAAGRYGFDFHYVSRPSWVTYESLLEFADVVRHDVADLRPRDKIDLQSFIWVIGSDEYADY